MGGKRAHAGTVTCCALGENFVISGSDDGTLFGWRIDGTLKNATLT